MDIISQLKSVAALPKTSVAIQGSRARWTVTIEYGLTWDNDHIRHSRSAPTLEEAATQVMRLYETTITKGLSYALNPQVEDQTK